MVLKATGDEGVDVDWKSDEVQIVVVDLKTLHGNPQAIAKMIASEINRLGYLKDSKKPLSIMGYSFRCFIGLELCKELSNNYSCIPLAFFPVAYAAPHACRSKLQRIPSALIRKKNYICMVPSPDFKGIWGSGPRGSAIPPCIFPEA